MTAELLNVQDCQINLFVSLFLIKILSICFLLWGEKNFKSVPIVFSKGKVKSSTITKASSVSVKSHSVNATKAPSGHKCFE